MEQMTIRQALEATVKVIRQIRVPIDLANEIAAPLVGCVENLNICIRTLAENERQAEEHEGEPNHEESDC